MLTQTIILLANHTVVDTLITLPSNVIDPEDSNPTDASYTTVPPSPIIAEAGEYQIGFSEIPYYMN